MKVGLIGAGNMASALARGWGEPVVVADPLRERAEALAAEVGGEVAGSNAEVAERADLVVLCHKPPQLPEVARDVAGAAKAVVSILGGTPVADVEAVYPDTPVYRFLPSIPAEVRQGISCYVPGRLASEGPEDEVLELFGRVGTVIRLPEPLVEPATALMSCGPAFLALVAESLIDAGVKRGLEPADATTMVVGTMSGTAAVLRERGEDPVELRRRVTSPGGMTERGVAVLEGAGVRTAFDDAVTAAVGISEA